MKRTGLKELLEKGQVVVPGIYDCISAQAVNLTGFQAAYLSSRGVAYSWRSEEHTSELQSHAY